MICIFSFYLEVAPEGLPVLRAGLLKARGRLPDSDAAAGSTAGWARGSASASAPPGGSGPGYWPWARLAVASCGWGTRFCGMSQDEQNEHA